MDDKEIANSPTNPYTNQMTSSPTNTNTNTDNDETEVEEGLLDTSTETTVGLNETDKTDEPMETNPEGETALNIPNIPNIPTGAADPKGKDHEKRQTRTKNRPDYQTLSGTRQKKLKTATTTTKKQKEKELENKLKERITNLEQTVILYQNENEELKQKDREYEKRTDIMMEQMDKMAEINAKQREQIKELTSDLEKEIQTRLNEPTANQAKLNILEQEIEELTNQLDKQTEITEHTEKLNIELKARINLMQNRFTAKPPTYTNIHQQKTLSTETTLPTEKKQTPKTYKFQTQTSQEAAAISFADMLTRTPKSPPTPTPNPTKKPTIITIIGDSNTRQIIEYLNQLDTSKRYQIIDEARKAEEIIPTIQKTKHHETAKNSDQILILMGTNNLRQKDDAEKIATELIEAAKYITTTTLTTTRIITPPPIDVSNVSVIKQAKKLNNLLNDQQKKPINTPKTYRMPLNQTLKEDGYHLTNQAAKTMAYEINSQTLTQKQATTEKKISYTPNPQSIPHIIGKKGKKIKELADTYQVKIKVQDGNIHIKGLNASEAIRDIKTIDNEIMEGNMSDN